MEQTAETTTFRGKGWYITDIDLSDARYQDKDLYLEVQGASKITDVYVNGEYVGTHEGGWSTFRFDISAYVNDGVNQIAAVAWITGSIH